MSDFNTTFEELSDQLLEAGFNVGETEDLIHVLDKDFRTVTTIQKYVRKSFNNHYPAYDKLAYSTRRLLLGLITDFLLTPADIRFKNK